MADNNNNNNSNTNTNSGPPAKKQEIPFYSIAILILKRVLGVAFSAGGILMFLSTVMFVYDYYNGVRGYDRSLEIYKNTFDNVAYMGKWFDIKDVFAYAVHSVQDNFEVVSEKFNGNGNVNGLISLKSDAFGFKDKIVNAYKDNITTDKGMFLGGWKSITEFLYYYLMDSLFMALTFCLKLLMIINFLPVYLLLLIPAFANGYSNRKIATFKGELDKEDRVELAFRKLRISTITIMYTFIAIPHAINPIYFLAPSVVLTALSIRFLARYYKKYW